MQNCQWGGDILSYSFGEKKLVGCHFWFKVLALADRNGIQPLWHLLRSFFKERQIKHAWACDSVGLTVPIWGVKHLEWHQLANALHIASQCIHGHIVSSRVRGSLQQAFNLCSLEADSVPRHALCRCMQLKSKVSLPLLHRGHEPQDETDQRTHKSARKYEVVHSYCLNNLWFGGYISRKGINPDNHRNESAYTSRAGGYADVMWTVQKGHQRIKSNKWSTVQHVESNKAWFRFKSGCVRVVARRLFSFMMNERGPTISQFHHNSVLS